MLPIATMKKKNVLKINNSREQKSNIEVTNKTTLENNFWINLAHSLGVDKVHQITLFKLKHRKETIKLEKILDLKL